MKTALSAILCLALTALTCGQGRAAVTFVDIVPDQFVTTPRAGTGFISEYDIDFNSDGNREVRIYVSANSTIGFNAQTVSGSRVAGIPFGLGFYEVFPALAGQAVGPTPLGPSTWVANPSIGVNLGACTGFGDLIVCDGYFVEGFVGYVPVEFTLADGIHYGVIEIEGLYGNGRIRSYAWETTPGTPITAPEPGRMVLCVAGMIAALARCRRRALGSG